MEKIGKNRRGFSAVEALLIVVIIGIVGFTGYYVWHTKQNTDKSLTSNNSSTPIVSKKTATSPAKQADPYAGWKTYHSILNSGLSFKYPADWVFTPATQVAPPNSLGGVENDSVLYSVEPTGTHSSSTNLHLDLSFDEYSGNGWSNSDWTLGKLLTSEPFQSGSSKLSLNTYQGDTPMQDQIIVMGENSNSHGNHYINTQNGHYVAITAAFNNGQNGFPAGTNMNEDFASRPEVATAKLIIKSVQVGN